MNFDAVTGSPRPRTSRSSLPGVVAPMPPPFLDPILSIIRNSVPSLDPVVVPPVSPREASTYMGIPPVGTRTSRNSQFFRPATLSAGTECQMRRSSPAIPGQEIDSGAHSEVMALLREEVPVQRSPGHISSGPQEQPVANVAAASTMPEHVICLSDSDE